MLLLLLRRCILQLLFYLLLLLLVRISIQETSMSQLGSLPYCVEAVARERGQRQVHRKVSWTSMDQRLLGLGRLGQPTLHHPKFHRRKPHHPKAQHLNLPCHKSRRINHHPPVQSFHSVGNSLLLNHEISETSIDCCTILLKRPPLAFEGQRLESATGGRKGILQAARI